MLARFCQDNSIKAKAVVDHEEEEDTKIEGIPEAQDVQAKALFSEANNFVQHVANTPEPEDNF